MTRFSHKRRACRYLGECDHAPTREERHSYRRDAAVPAGTLASGTKNIDVEAAERRKKTPSGHSHSHPLSHIFFVKGCVAPRNHVCKRRSRLLFYLSFLSVPRYSSAYSLTLSAVRSRPFLTVLSATTLHPSSDFSTPGKVILVNLNRR